MRSHQKKKSGFIRSNILRVTGGVLAASSLMLASPLMAADFSFSGESSTLLRMRTTIDKKDLYPVYEYLRLNMTDNRSDGSAVSFYLGAWGRADLAEKSTDKHADADLQYAYLSYRAAKNNTVVNLGRQFVTEGVAAEKLDGLYLRNDFAGGFGAAAFAGKSVITEPDNKGGNFVYGARLSQGISKYYSVGLSALKSETDVKSRYREEFGADLWLHPMKQVDLTGRSSYNNLTEGWMEHAYVLSIAPLEPLRISADFSQINYRDYFYNMTTNIFSFANRVAIQNIARDEKLTTVGAALSYSPLKNFTVSADYKNYSYNIDKNADYFGGKATYSLPESFAVGCSVHRMEGKVDRLRYTEYRAYASKKFGHADLALDLTNVGYDNRINGVRNSFALTGSAGYEFGHRLKVGTDIEYSQSPDFDNEVRGLLKVTYLFDTKRSEGRSKK